MTVAAEPSDHAERLRFRSDLHRTHLVEAGAGTGKTTAVVGRITAAVAAGVVTRMDRLVAITFTVAAAGELRVRLRAALEVEATRHDGVERERLARAAGEVDLARVETIHAFCSTLLRLFPFEAGLSPSFTMLSALGEDLELQERFRRWFSDLPVEGGPSAAVRRGLLVGIRPEDVLLLARELARNWDLLDELTIASGSAPDGVVEEALDEALASLRGALLHRGACRVVDDGLLRDLEAAVDPVARAGRAGSDIERVAALVEIAGLKGGNSGNRENWPQGVCAEAKECFKAATATATAALRRIRADVLGTLATAVCAWIREWADERRDASVLTFQDLLVRARDLLRDHPEVRTHLHGMWDLVAVDEFQDTDPLQAEIVLRLTAAGASAGAVEWRTVTPVQGRLCVVGDPKQSIYRFRRADIALYQAVERSLCASDESTRVRLTENFRSTRAVIDSVNHVFGGPEGLMLPGEGATGEQAPWVPLTCHDPGTPGRVGIFGTCLHGTAPPMWQREAEDTAALVGRIVGECWQVRDDAGALRDVRLGDICIVMPARTNLRRIERELERARVPYRLDSGALVVATQEVRDLLNILRTVDDPSDEVSLVAALRTPAFGCSDVDLVRWRAHGGRWSYRRTQNEEAIRAAPRVDAALEALRGWRERRLMLSVPRLIEEIVTTRLLRLAAFDTWRPRETRRRYHFVVEHTRALAATGRTSLHDAVSSLEQLVDDPQYDSVVSDAGAGDDCVRITTVHSAKGLEYPVVILVGTARKPNPRQAPLVIDRRNRALHLCVKQGYETAGYTEAWEREKRLAAEEGVRLLYVGMTRARDHLLVSTWRSATKGKRNGNPTDAERLEQRLGRLEFVEHIDVPAVPPAARSAASTSASADTDALVRDHRATEAAWSAQRSRTLQSAHLAVATATALAHSDEEPPDGEAPSDVTARRRGRGATALGRAVHAVLQVCDLGSPGDVAALAAVAAANEGIPDRADEVTRLVVQAVATSTARQAATVRHWREVPLGASVDGRLLEGFVDLLYEDGAGGLVVADWKTDSVGAGGVDDRVRTYGIQGGAYALLVETVLRRRVSRIEFVFAALGEVRTITDVAGVVAEARARLDRPDALEAGAGVSVSG